jgi:hypothetical protein
MIISGVTLLSWVKQSITSLDMSVIIVNWSSEPPREQLEHEWVSPNVNMWYLTHERVIGLYFLDEDIIIRSSFLHMLETYALPQRDSNNNFTIQVYQAPLF